MSSTAGHPHPGRIAVLISLAAMLVATVVAAQSGSRSASPAASAAPRGSAAASASALPARSAAPVGSAAASGSASPPGELPDGHPPIADAHGHPPPQEQQRMQPDEVRVEPSLPTGTVSITIVDASDQPIPGAPIDLDIDTNIVSQGESHETKSTTADGDGRARFDGLRVGTGIAYRVRTTRGEAAFASEPFGLKDKAGVAVVLHAYDPVSTLEQAAFVMEAFVLLDIKQDTIRVNHLLHTLNVGRHAFVPRGIRMQLPKGAAAFKQEEGHGSGTLAERDGVVELGGTFPPGQGELTYGYTIPLGSSSELSVHVPLPPRVIKTTVMVNAGKGMVLEVAGFPAAKLGQRGDGQKVLKTTKEADLSQGLAALLSDVSPGDVDVIVRGLPTSGYGPLIAVALAVIAVVIGVSQRGLATTARDAKDLALELREAREALLQELVLLEKAHKSGDVGPVNYERLRNALLDALARILTRLGEKTPGAAYRS